MTKKPNLTVAPRGQGKTQRSTLLQNSIDDPNNRNNFLALAVQSLGTCAANDADELIGAATAFLLFVFEHEPPKVVGLQGDSGRLPNVRHAMLQMACASFGEDGAPSAKAVIERAKKLMKWQLEHEKRLAMIGHLSKAPDGRPQ